MKRVAAMFSEEAKAALSEHLNIYLSDEHDYTQDELAQLYDRITDEFPYAYGEDGKPLPLGVIFEGIVDVFSGQRLVEFNG